MAHCRMAARGSRLTPFARYGQPINEDIISGLLLGFPVVIPLQVGVRTMEVGVICQPCRVGPPAHPVRDITLPTRLVYDNNVVPRKEFMPKGRDDPEAQPWYRDPPCTMTRGTSGPLRPDIQVLNVRRQGTSA